MLVPHAYRPPVHGLQRGTKSCPTACTPGGRISSHLRPRVRGCQASYGAQGLDTPAPQQELEAFQPTACHRTDALLRERQEEVQPLQPAGKLALGLCLATTSAAVLAWPGLAHAGEGALTGQAMELFEQFLDQVESMGPSGAVLFVFVVMVFEMVPLFPTQPLSLASGLLFGAQKGAVLMLIGVTLAATNAFLISRGVGRPLAQKVIEAEMGHAGEPGVEGTAGTVAKALAGVQTAIDGGGMWKQMTAVALLRLTPVVPFSASNYLLGLTPVQLPAFLVGTVLGMSVWSTIYASLGGASRALLDRGVDYEVLLADLSDKAAAMSSSALGATAAVVAALAAVYAVRTYTQRPAGGEQGSSSSAEDLPVRLPSPPTSQAAEKEAVAAGRASPHRAGRD